MSNIIITPTGREYPASSKADWNTWKFCLSLNIDELSAYILILRDKMKDLERNKESYQDLINLRRQYKLASDTLTIKNRCPNIEDATDVYLDDIKNISSTILGNFEYNNTSIYYQEVDTIVNCLKEEEIILNKCKYDEYVYACVIVSEILDKYSAKYDENYLLKTFDVSPIDYTNLKIILNKWLIGNYWLE